MPGHGTPSLMGKRLISDFIFHVAKQRIHPAARFLPVKG